MKRPIPPLNPTKQRGLFHVAAVDAPVASPYHVEQGANLFQHIAAALAHQFEVEGEGLRPTLLLGRRAQGNAVGNFQNRVPPVNSDHRLPAEIAHHEREPAPIRRRIQTYRAEQDGLRGTDHVLHRLQTVAVAV